MGRFDRFPVNLDDSCNYSRGEVNAHHYWLLGMASDAGCVNIWLKDIGWTQGGE